MGECFPCEELGSPAPQGGNRGEEAPPRRFDPSLALESSGKGEDLGLRVWVRGEGEEGRARAGSGEGEGVGGEEKRE